MISLNNRFTKFILLVVCVGVLLIIARVRDPNILEELNEELNKEKWKIAHFCGQESADELHPVEPALAEPIAPELSESIELEVLESMEPEVVEPIQAEVLEQLEVEPTVENVPTIPPTVLPETTEPMIIPAYPLTDKSRIEYKVTDKIKDMALFKVFERRKGFHAYACQHARKVFQMNMTYEERKALQNRIQDGAEVPDEKECLPAMSREGSPENHFYDDKHKFHVCLPTKTGSTNWLKMLYSLFQFEGNKDPAVIDKNYIYHMPQMPRFSEPLDEFRKGRSGRDGYFTMISVRHPMARLHSAWKDKFRNNHAWFKYINLKFGSYLKLLERKDMSKDPYEISFEAYLEVAAISMYDTERDRHWKSIQTYCSSCNMEYDWILKQENAIYENEFLTKVLGFDRKYPLLKVPRISTVREVELNSKSSIEEMVLPYRNVSKTVIEALYKNYYSDFVFFNYSIDEFYDVARETDDPSIIRDRKTVRTQMATKFGYYQKRSDDNTCVGDHHYNCEFGVWKKLENKVLGGAAQPWGDKKFATLDQAQKFACDKAEITGIVFTDKVYITRGGSTGLRDSAKKEITWIKQFSAVTIV